MSGATFPRHLVRRDRLQSGMSAATVVMQTDIVGGSMHTVRFTLLQGRQLFAPVPSGSHAGDPKSRGILALTRETGTHLSSILHASGEYRDILRTRYSNTPPASSISGRHAYPDFLRQLHNILPTSGYQHAGGAASTHSTQGPLNGCLPI